MFSACIFVSVQSKRDILSETKYIELVLVVDHTEVRAQPVRQGQALFMGSGCFQLGGCGSLLMSGRNKLKLQKENYIHCGFWLPLVSHNDISSVVQQD